MALFPDRSTIRLPTLPLWLHLPRPCQPHLISMVAAGPLTPGPPRIIPVNHYGSQSRFPLTEQRLVSTRQGPSKPTQPHLSSCHLLQNQVMLPHLGRHLRQGQVSLPHLGCHLRQGQVSLPHLAFPHSPCSVLEPSPGQLPG